MLLRKQLLRYDVFMSTNVQDLYAQTVRPLPTQERLQLAALILTELAQTPAAVDYENAWSEEDQADLASFSLSYAARFYVHSLAAN
jgi:hypothetical protein